MALQSLLALFFLLIPGVFTEDAPSAENFERRINPRAAVINNRLFLDGGAVAAKDLDSTSIVNNTLSLDLSTSWAPQDASFREIDKTSQDIPSLWKHAIFVNEKDSEFYIWGGRYFWQNGVPPVELWKFSSDNNGGGVWSIEDHDSSFEKIKRSEGGAYVSTKDAGFWFGGAGLPSTHKGLSRTDMLGFVSFNYTTKKWTNHTDSPYSSKGTIVYSTATYLPGIGPNGIIVLLGGYGQTEPETKELLPLDIVYFIDPVTLKWFKQKTSGPAPGQRGQHCTVGVAGNETYEIFLHGGVNPSTGTVYDDVHILSLPGFVWTNTGATSSQKRVEMACVGAGNRYMLSIGGVKRLGTDDEADKNPQGLGIFDMNALEWKSRYTPDAGSYETPKIVKKFYDDGGLDQVDFSDGVKDLFPQKKAEGNTTSSSNGEKDKNNSSLPAGAIAGIVIGALIGVSIFAVGIFFIVQRKRKRVEVDASPPQYSAVKYSIAPDQTLERYAEAVYPSELSSSDQRFELPSESGYQPRSVSELPGRPG